jgi:hypothetical protein
MSILLSLLKALKEADELLKRILDSGSTSLDGLVLINNLPVG